MLELVVGKKTTCNMIELKSIMFLFQYSNDEKDNRVTNFMGEYDQQYSIQQYSSAAVQQYFGATAIHIISFKLSSL